MAENKKAFVLGPGFVGREVIDLLRHEGYSVTTIVRRDSAKEEFAKDGVKAVKGDLEDVELIQDLASESDVVFHTATADHLASAEAILEGIRIRNRKGQQSIYLHQSGASVLSDGTSNIANPKVVSDNDTSVIDALPGRAPHRSIDLAILRAREDFDPNAKMFIMMPPIIYGSNKKYGRLSIQAYMLIVKSLEAGTSALNLTNPYFFCENGEISWRDLAALIGRDLHKNGKVESPEPRQIPSSEWTDLFGEFTPAVVGCNARNKADRLRELGWSPRELDVAKAYESEDLPILLKETEFSRSGLTLS
ncbi:MAG: hypothetical protein M1821_007988 [Bathelium mastoideum]|nr:MAG: hypothetical protein M1821_007988 [Bathelium mastoideum]KAI9693034.1 MAG: hypothetical protein M1822_005029 [Bathelium mastoideum]